jgi:hypothetical protein
MDRCLLCGWRLVGYTISRSNNLRRQNSDSCFLFSVFRLCLGR